MDMRPHTPKLKWKRGKGLGSRASQTRPSPRGSTGPMLTHRLLF